MENLLLIAAAAFVAIVFAVAEGYFIAPLVKIPGPESLRRLRPTGRLVRLGEADRRPGSGSRYLKAEFDDGSVYYVEVYTGGDPSTIVVDSEGRTTPTSTTFHVYNEVKAWKFRQGRGDA